MSFHVISPPKSKDQKELAECAKEVIDAITEAGGTAPDPEGFVYSWLQGMRVAVERNDAGKITGVCMFTAGKRWSDNDISAHALRLEGRTDGLIDFVKTLCVAIGATKFFVEEDEPSAEVDGIIRHTVREYVLQ